MELSKKLSKNMKTLRGSKSQAAFSKEIGIAKATVNSIETQRASIRLDTLEVICLHLGIPPQSLLSDEMDCMESGMLEYLLGADRVVFEALSGGPTGIHTVAPAYRRPV